MTPFLWGIPEWDPKIVLPALWLMEGGEPSERGPFHVIHCDNVRLAVLVSELLNENGVDPAELTRV